ncbi:HAD-IIIC family phosphatase [Candidatus Woesearchaeota archaeon]|nr:HAD-IIIC family phosphatase [Candidatus Woesearchaeota archaeon]
MKLSDYINKSKQLVKKNSMKSIRIAFLSNSTITGLAETMKVMCFEQDIYADCYTAPYNQYMQEILNNSSGLYSFNPNIIFIFLDTENFLGDFYYFPYRKNAQQRKEFIQEKFTEIKDLIMMLKKKTDAKIVINNILIPFYTTRGIIENKQEFGMKESMRQFNQNLEALSANDSQLFVFDTTSFYVKFGHDKICDRKMCYMGDIKISHPSLINLAKEYLAYIFPLMSMTKKCIVLDLDNTLWGGIIGEDGMENIKLGPEKEGKPFLDFQKRLLELFERGIILAINSKNNYDDALEVIRNHPYMLLREDMFACMRINWQNKAANMIEIAKELNIGLDSLIFIDDDKTNRELIKEFVPEVLVVDLPEDPCLYPKAIEDLAVFNLFDITDSDLKKGKMYVDQKKRAELKSEVKDLTSFLKQLKIVVTISEAQKASIPRISQLTKKTNQFNLTTQRYEAENIKSFSDSEDYLVKCIDVVDKFGEYGITGATIIRQYAAEEHWEIDTFLLSCRILGKDIEFSFMKNIIDAAKKEGIKKISAKFIPTKKNKPAENFLTDCGFNKIKEQDGEIYYQLEVGKEKNKDILMEVKEWKN